VVLGDEFDDASQGADLDRLMIRDRDMELAAGGRGQPDV
jgi:hypothetical protein